VLERLSGLAVIVSVGCVLVSARCPDEGGMVVVILCLCRCGSNAGIIIIIYRVLYFGVGQAKHVAFKSSVILPEGSWGLVGRGKWSSLLAVRRVGGRTGGLGGLPCRSGR